MTVDVLNSDGTRSGSLELDDAIYGGEVKEHLFWEVVKMQMANRRSGNASTKTRSEVRGGGAKPWKQKGTGRARAGTTRSPLWRHGGVVFGPKPRDYSYKVPRKVVKAAMKSALRLKVRDSALRVFDALELSEPKTKAAAGLLGKADLKSALIVTDGENRNLRLAVRNLKGFKVIEVAGINVYDVLKYEHLVMTRTALEKVEASIR